MPFGIRRMMTLFFARLGVAVVASAAFGAPAFAGEGPPVYAGDAPPHARPGQCFQKVERRPIYDTVSEQVVDQPAHTVTHIIPAQTRWEDRRVLVSPGRIDERPVAEVGHDVTETVVVRPPSVRTDVIPAVCDVVPVQVLIRPARTYWKRTWGANGEVMCLVTDPPVWGVQMQTVVRVPARTVQTPIPGENRVVVRHVVDVPAHVDRHEVEPVYRIDHVQVTVAPERAENETIPATYRTVSHQRLVTPGGWEWREVGCTAPPPPCHSCDAPPPPPPPSPCATCLPPADGRAPDMAPPPPPPEGARHRRHDRWTRGVSGMAPGAGPANMTAQIQTALRKRGFYKGPVDGLYTGETSGALAGVRALQGPARRPPHPRRRPRARRLLNAPARVRRCGGRAGD